MVALAATHPASKPASCSSMAAHRSSAAPWRASSAACMSSSAMPCPSGPSHPLPWLPAAVTGLLVGCPASAASPLTLLSTRCCTIRRLLDISCRHGERGTHGGCTWPHRADRRLCVKAALCLNSDTHLHDALLLTQRPLQLNQLGPQGIKVNTGRLQGAAMASTSAVGLQGAAQLRQKPNS